MAFTDYGIAIRFEGGVYMTDFVKTWRRVGNTDLFQGGRMSPIMDTDCPWAIKTNAYKEMVVQPGELEVYTLSLAVTLKTDQLLA